MPEFDSTTLNELERSAWVDRLERDGPTEVGNLFGAFLEAVELLRSKGNAPDEIAAEIMREFYASPELRRLGLVFHHKSIILFNAMVRQAIEQTDQEQTQSQHVPPAVQPVPDEPESVPTSDLEPPLDYGYLSEEQTEHMDNVGRQPGGWNVVRTYSMVIKMRVDRCKSHGLGKQSIIDTIMCDCWNGYPGIPDEDLSPLTRGFINCALEDNSE